MKQNIFLLLYFLAVLSKLQGQSPLRIANVTIIHPETAATQSARDIWLEGGKITAIKSHKSLTPQKGETVIDATGKWVIPGLTDGHVHFFQSGGLYARPDIIDLRSLRSAAGETNRVKSQSADFAHRYLSCGITTVCDMGGPFSNFEIRESARKDSFSPDLYVTGPLISSYQPEELGFDDPPILLVKTPEAAREIVRALLPYKPDYIKIWYIVRRGESPESFRPIAEAVADEAHTHGLPLAVHATQLETARIAVMAGADILVHSVDDQIVDEDFVNMLAEKKVSYIPTLVVSENYSRVFSQEMAFLPEDFDIANPYTLGSLMDLQHIEKEDIPADMRQRIFAPFVPSARKKTMYENLRRLQAAGVNIVTGTDAGNIGTLHASSYYSETEAMRAAGMTPEEILRACTVNPTKMLKPYNQQQMIAPGKPADLVILEENPLENIRNLSQVQWVIRKGVVISPETLITASPEMIAQKQLNAWNQGNIDKYAACFSDSVEVYNYPNKLLYKGKKALYDNYEPFFAANRGAHCEIANRMVAGDVVIDEELIQLPKQSERFRVIAIYDVKQGQITAIRFIWPD
ncbi:MAG: amidohydrolase family protein [Bacteroidia bacterium]